MAGDVFLSLVSAAREFLALVYHSAQVCLCIWSTSAVHTVCEFSALVFHSVRIVHGDARPVMDAPSCHSFI
jgi:hypothetical protein